MMGTNESEPDMNSPKQERLDLYLDLGILLYKSGASAQRVIDSVQHLATALGDSTLHLFIFYNAIEINFKAEEETFVGMRILKGRMREDLAALHEISRLLHSFDTSSPDIAVIRREVDRIKEAPKKYPWYLIIPAVGVACAAFGVLNYADLSAFLIIFIAASVAFGAGIILAPYSRNSYFTTLLIALTGGIIAALLIPVFPTATPGLALLSTVLFLSPGMFFLTGGFDMMRDYMNCGIPRVTVAGIEVCMLAIALVIPLAISHAVETPSWVGASTGTLLMLSLTMGIIAGVGFGILFNAPLLLLPCCALLAGLARLVREICIINGSDPLLAVFIAIVIATSCAWVIGKRLHVPPIALAVIPGVLMVPGVPAIRTLQGLFLIANPGSQIPPAVFISTMQNGFFVIGVIAAIIIGIILPLEVLHRGEPRI